MIELIVKILLISGTFFFLGTVVGLIRFPDFFTRVHAASKGDTLSSIMLLSGLAIYNLSENSFDSLLVSLKIVLIIAFVFIASPAAAHSLTEAGFLAGYRPWTNDLVDEKEKEEEK